MDKRQALASNTTLNFDGMTCTIHQEIGRGSNSIVYNGWYQDTVSTGQKHHVLIKELFPYDEHAAVYREGDDVHWLPEAEASVGLHRQSFLWGNETHLKLRERYPSRTGGNINTYTLNNTYYTLLDFSGGRALDQELAQSPEPSSLRRMAVRMIDALEALEVFHESGYLHLDVSPDNILLLDAENRERVELIDYNSAVRLTDIAQGKNILVSMKTGYASPEMRRHAYGEVGPWTDLYSVTAVFFRCLTGKILSRMQASGVMPANISGSAALRDVPDTVRSLAAQIVAKGLAAVPRARYQTAADMLVDFRELIDRIDGVGVTHSALWEAASKSVRRIVELNPSLAYLKDQDTLFPVDVALPDGSRTDDALQSDRNAVLTGSGGMGKTTLLLRRAWLASRKYSAVKPVVLYMSLYGYQEGSAHFICENILRKLMFKPDMGTYDDARHALEQLLQKPLRAHDSEAPALILLLDGYNEISGSTSALLQEMESLAGMAGVRLLTASRTEIPELSFETWRLMPLPEPAIREILNTQGILMPDSPQVRELLANAMMLRLFSDACRDAKEQISVKTGYELIDAYLQSLQQKEISKLPESSPEKWRLSAAIDYVYPMIARQEARKKRALTNLELLNLVTMLFKQLGTRTFTSLFPKWVGRSPDIRGGAKTAETWYNLIIHDLLWRRLGLLYQDERGEYRVVHQGFLEAMETKAERIQKALTRKKTSRSILSSLLCLVVFAALYIMLPQQAPPYDVDITKKMLSHTQAICLDMNKQYVALNALVHPEAPDFTPDFDKAKRYVGNSGFLAMLGSNIDLGLDMRCKQLEETGQRIPWGTLSFDSIRFNEMAHLLADRTDRYTQYLDMLQTVYSKGKEEDYLKVCKLVSDVLEADANVAAVYEYIVYALRIDGIAVWESTAKGKAYAGSYASFVEGRKTYSELSAHADADWPGMTLDDVISALSDKQDAVRFAEMALADDDTYSRLKRDR